MPQVVNNELIKKYKEEETRLEVQKARLSARYTGEHPDLISVQNQINALKAKIDGETEKIIQSVKIDLSGQFLGNNVRIIDSALVPLKPYKPDKKLNLLIGTAAGLLLGFICALIADLSDRTVKTPEDLEEKLGISFLGLSHFEKAPQGRAEYSSLLEETPNLSAEAVRNIRTMLDFALPPEKEKTVVVASSVQGEGKSYLSANLAVAVAQTGEKTLLIDGDLRRPRLHKIFKLSNDGGLSKILSSQNQNLSEEIEKAVLKTGVENLYVLPSGKIPPNPAELLNTPKLKAFIETAEKKFDRIIVDCPAVLPVADSLLWAKCARSAVFALKASSTNAKLAQTALERLKKTGIKILGAVITMHKDKSLKAYRHYYQND